MLPGWSALGWLPGNKLCHRSCRPYQSHVNLPSERPVPRLRTLRSHARSWSIIVARQMAALTGLASWLWRGSQPGATCDACAETGSCGEGLRGNWRHQLSIPRVWLVLWGRNKGTQAKFMTCSSHTHLLFPVPALPSQKELFGILPVNFTLRG